MSTARALGGVLAAAALQSDRCSLTRDGLAPVAQTGLRCRARSCGAADAQARSGRRVKTTVSDKTPPCQLDKVNRQFTAHRPNRLWVSDFTYVPTWAGMVYVAFVIDVFARRIVGWRASRDRQRTVRARRAQAGGPHAQAHRARPDPPQRPRRATRLDQAHRALRRSRASNPRSPAPATATSTRSPRPVAGLFKAEAKSSSRSPGAASLPSISL